MSKLDAKNMFVANLELRLCGGGRETGLSVIEAELVHCCKVERGRVVSKSSFVLDDGTRPTFFVVFCCVRLTDSEARIFSTNFPNS